MPNFSFLSGSNILVRVGWGGWLYSDYNASLSSNWTELDLTGTELGKTVNEILLHLDEQNIAISHYIFKTQDWNFTCKPNFYTV